VANPSDARSAEAVVFGAGRPHIGALILPTELAKDLTPAQFFPLIWPTIQLANEAAPSHSRLLPEMLIYLKYNTKLPRADKGSVIRPRTYVQFEAAIEEVRTVAAGIVFSDLTWRAVALPPVRQWRGHYSRPRNAETQDGG
jgi:hypothetical protein